VKLSPAELAQRMVELPDRFLDRLDEQALTSVRRTLDAGEWPESVQALIRALRRLDSPVTTRERTELAAYLETFDSPDHPEPLRRRTEQVKRDLASLTEQPSLSATEATARARTLLETFGPRIPEPDRGELIQEHELENWPDLTLATVELLERHGIPVTPEERRMLTLLLDAMDLSREGLTAIPVR
jgi:hypothetical protein